MALRMFWKFLRYHSYCHAALVASWVVPRSKAIWVIGGSKGLRFADNARHFALQARHTWPNQKIIWLARSAEVREQASAAGIPSHHPTSPAGLWFGLRASWHIFDINVQDTSRFSSIGAKWLNLWHGVPLKSLDNIRPRPNTSAVASFHDWWYRKKSQYQRKYLAHPTPAHFDYLSKVLDLPFSNIITANLPRNQQLLYGPGPDLSAAEVQLRQELAQSGKTVIGYFPTWRDTGVDRFLGAQDDKCISLLNDALARNNAVLITKWHSCSYRDYKHRGASQTAAAIDAMLAQSPNIRRLPFQCDLNTILDCCDMLISDYSGVMIDYLLLDRPILQAPYDLEEYRVFTGLLPDYEKFSSGAGPLVKNVSQLIDHLEQYFGGGDSEQHKYRNSRSKLASYYFPTSKGLSALEGVLHPE